MTGSTSMPMVRCWGGSQRKLPMVLMGKHRPDYTPFVDTGDFVIVTNAEKVIMTGDKLETKYYDYYTYYPGGHRLYKI